MCAEEDGGKDVELQEALDRQSKELLHLRERVASLCGRVAELEDDLDTARKDLIKSEDINSRLQRDLREVRAFERASYEPVCDRVFLWFLSVSGSEGGHGGEDHHAGEALPSGSERSYVCARHQRQTGERDGQQGLAGLPGVQRVSRLHQRTLAVNHECECTRSNFEL